MVILLQTLYEQRATLVRTIKCVSFDPIGHFVPIQEVVVDIQVIIENAVFNDHGSGGDFFFRSNVRGSRRAGGDIVARVKFDVFDGQRAALCKTGIIAARDIGLKIAAGDLRLAPVRVICALDRIAGAEDLVVAADGAVHVVPIRPKGCKAGHRAIDGKNDLSHSAGFLPEFI